MTHPQPKDEKAGTSPAASFTAMMAQLNPEEGEHDAARKAHYRITLPAHKVRQLTYLASDVARLKESMGALPTARTDASQEEKNCYMGFRASVNSLSCFIARLEATKIPSQGIELNWEELPQRWHVTFPLIRSQVLDAIGESDPTLAKKCQTPQTLEKLLQKGEAAPLATFLGTLDKVYAKLNELLPLEALAQTSTPTFFIKKAENDALTSIDFNGLTQAITSQTDMAVQVPAMQRMEQLLTRLHQFNAHSPNKKIVSGTSVPLDTIPGADEMITYLSAARRLIVDHLLELPIPDFLDHEFEGTGEEKTITPQALGTCMLALNKRPSADDFLNKRYISSPLPSYNLQADAPQLTKPEFQSALEALNACHTIDLAAATWEQHLRNIEARIEKSRHTNGRTR